MVEYVVDPNSLNKRSKGGVRKGRCCDWSTDVQRLHCVLNIALAAELASAIRCKQISSAAYHQGVDTVANEVLVLSCEEQDHVDAIADRIVQLGGEPRFKVGKLTKNFGPAPSVSMDLETMIRDLLDAERVAIDMYADVTSWLGDCDAMTGFMMKSIVAAKKVRAQDLLDLLKSTNW
jgi:bacterioferritin